eukprot:687103-Hanusia_phi.AAC.1
MEKKCSDLQSGCTLRCGGSDFKTCGSEICNVGFCSQNFDLILRVGAASCHVSPFSQPVQPIADASDLWSKLNSEITNVQCIANLIGVLLSWAVVAVPGLLAALRTSVEALMFANVSSACCSPLFLGLGLWIIMYSKQIQDACGQHPNSPTNSCNDSIAEGLFDALCVKNDFGIGLTDSYVLLSAITLIIQGFACAVFSTVMYLQRNAFIAHNKRRIEIMKSAVSFEEMIRSEKRQNAQRQQERNIIDKTLVFNEGFVQFPGLLQIFKGHTQGVSCLQVVEFRGRQSMLTGSQDGCVMLWSMETGSFLRKISAHFSSVAGVKAFWKFDINRQCRKSRVMYKTTTPIWDETDTQTFKIKSDDQLIWVNLYDWKRYGNDELIGTCSFNLTDYKKSPRDFSKILSLKLYDLSEFAGQMTQETSGKPMESHQ